MKERLGRALAWLAAAGAVVLVALALDWVPARSPEAPERAKYDPAALVERPAVTAAAAKKPAVPAGAVPTGPETAPIRAIPVCDAPAKGARVFRVSLLAGSESLFVWCKGEYVRLDLTLRGDVLQAQRGGRFPASVELPGGVTAADFDADGVTDLVLATATPNHVLHRPGAGAFLLRGRREGGYEPARALVEAPVVAVEAVVLDDQAGSDLLLVTRGDLTAQRPGELWLFQGGPSLKRVGQTPLGLGPRDLVLSSDETRGSPRDPTADERNQRSAWVAVPQAGLLLEVALSTALLNGQAADKRSLSFPGVQGLMTDPRGLSRALFARDASDIRRLSKLETRESAREENARGLESWAQNVHVGPGVIADLDGDSQPEVLALIDGGVTRVLGSGAVDQELRPSGQILDVSTIHDDAQRERAVALMVEPGASQLSLALLPKPPWHKDLKLQVEHVEVTDVPGLARVALE